VQPFEYLSVLISIILGLGITQLLSGFGRWLEQRATFRVYGPAIAWAAFLLVVDIQTWWSMFGLRGQEHWTFLQFVIVLLQPILLFLLAVLAFPTSASEVDLRTNYFLQRRWFFGILLLLLVVSVLKDLVISGKLPNAANLGFHAVFFATSAGALLTRRDGYHRAIAYVGLAGLLVYIALLFETLQ